MQSFYKGKKFLQLVLRKGDMERRKTAYFATLTFLLFCLFWLIIYKRPFLIYETSLLGWTSTAGITSSFFLAYKLYRSDQHRRKAEANAKISELKFNGLYNSGMIALWLTGEDGDVTQGNDAFLDITGYSRDELEAGLINWRKITPPEFREETRERLASLRDTGWCPRYEKEFIRQDGQRISVMVGYALLSGDRGSGIMAYALKITDANQSEEHERRRQEEMMRIFMDAPACIVIRKGPELKVTFINHAAIAQNQLGRANIEGFSTAEYFKKAGTNFDADILKRVYETGEPFKENAYHIKYDRHGNGQPIDAWYDIVMGPTRNTAGEIDGVVTYGFDVSAFVLANEELLASETRFRFIADAIPHKLWTSRSDGSASYYNQGWYDYTGTTDLAKLRDKIWSLIHPDDHENTRKLWTNAVEKGDDVEIEHRLKRHDGQYLWHLSRVCAHKDDSGKLKMWVGTSTNIHAQKIAQERTIASETHFRTLANSNSLLIWQTNQNGETTFVNDTWRAYTGAGSERLQAGAWSTNIHPDDREQAVNDFRAASEAKISFQSKYRFKDIRSGAYRWMLDNAQPVFDPEFNGYIGAMTDIHEQELAKLASDELIRKKDEFFSIASHELKTPTTTIKASLEILKRMLDQNPETGQLQTFIDKANKQATRLTGIVNDLLDINKIQFGKLELNPSLYAFGESLKECISEVQLQYPERDIQLADEIELVVWADRIRIEQVILNLLINAITYSSADQPISIILQKNGADYQCSVKDTGIGIPNDKQAKIFERFFRVHDNSQHYRGLGMGLYICAEIIKQHRGQIGVISKEGQGSTFWFTLPEFIKVV